MAAFWAFAFTRHRFRLHSIEEDGEMASYFGLIIIYFSQ